MYLPKARLGENGRQYCLGATKSAIETIEKPLQPRRNIEVTLLCRFENIVIGIALLSDLRGHAVEALRTFLRARKFLIGYGASDAAIAIVKGMDTDEPQVCDASLEDRINAN